MKPQPRPHVNITVGILKSFVAQAFSPIKIPHSVQVPTIALTEHWFGVTDAAWQSALGLVRGVGVKRARSAAHGPLTFDGLAETLDRGFFGLF